MNAIDFASKHLYPYKVRGREIIAEKCPYCGNRHKSKYKFFLNMDKETFKCFHGDCQKSGHLFELCRDFGEVYKTDNNFELRAVKKSYKKPNIKTNELSDAAIKYAYLRKISLTTLKAFKITQKDNNYVFPYYDENNELVFVKYRPIGKVKEGQKKAFREADTKPILFNMNNIDILQPVVITEGEFDCLAVYESGYKNVVSVPSGSSDFTWVENCWEWLEKLNKIILFGDNDEAGREMINKVILKLGEYRCYIANHEYKDANELLFRKGSDAVLKAIEEAKEVPKAGIIDVSEIDLFKPKTKGIKLGFRTIDKLLNGARLGEITVWTGKNGEGKSTILSEVILEAIEQDNKVFVYSGELTQRDFKEWLYSQAAGKENLKFVKNEFESYDVEFPEEVIRKIDNWIRGKLFLYDNTIKSQNIENTSILDMCKYSAKKYDCKIFVIDNLMTADFEGYADDFYRAQGKFVGELVSFVKSFNVHVHLVAHPKKQKGELEKEDISGTAEISNRVDNVIAVERNKSDDDSYDCKLRVLKNRNKGSLGEVKLIFSTEDKRFYELNEDGTCNRKIYSWNKQDGMIQVFEKCPWDE
ncbi:toprim domain-containing protein [Clostridium sp. SYSU_GA19001]|uniref:DnaB-like helicase C-terminal domain-containing protein n=1 Tax=Clostridium caldaquaticum TaxID=2940653 RepID=UPI002076FB47|nr:DnaB-like helicase C-terminal domain-containing protein [Clostridium caldaquaticum]MCM8710514.1 toprim domain-containing protein [Clostridium caldaquaticum]